MKSDKQKVLEWLANGNTGTSSKSIAFEFLGVQKDDIDAPYDPSDLNRCLELLAIAPEAKEVLSSLAARNKRWQIACDNWDKMTKMFSDEVGIGWKNRSKRAADTYQFMKSIGL